MYSLIPCKVDVVLSILSSNMTLVTRPWSCDTWRLFVVQKC